MSDGQDVPLRCVQIGAEWMGGTAGGLNRYFGELVSHLPAVGVNVRSTAAGQRPPNEPPGTSFALAEAPLHERWRRASREVARLLDGDNRPVADLLVSHFALYGWPAARAAARRDIPVVMHFHGPWADESQAEGGGRLGVWFKRFVERRAYNHARRVIVLSDAFKRVAVDSTGVDADRVRVVPGGVDVRRWSVSADRLAAREALGLPADRPIVVSVRRLVRRVGLEMLIAAVGRLRSERHQDVLLAIAGRGPLEQELRERIQAAGLSNHVRLLGFVPDATLPLLYRAADLSVVPSQSFEGFGLVTLESLATGTPCLATPVGGLPEALRPLDERLVLSDTSSDAIGRGIALALDRPSDWPSAAACQQYARQFDWSVIAQRVADVYREAVAA